MSLLNFYALRSVVEVVGKFRISVISSIFQFPLISRFSSPLCIPTIPASGYYKAYLRDIT